uniref:Tpr-related protein family member, putative n=1 Tax=Theileria annulata TaxID=5874 RepID=A0A3B0MY82_THEAN
MSTEEKDKTLKTAAFIFAGFSMMLNIRLCYSSAPYALIRFKLPEDLFSIFVRRMSSSLELWCLPSIVIGNVMDQFRIRASVDKKDIITWPSIVCMWIDFLTYVILLIVYLMGGEQGHLTAHYWIIAFSGFNFGIEMVLVYAQDDDGTITWYMVGENSFPLFTSLVHYFTTLMFGNRRKWNSDYIVVFVDIVAAIMISFTAAVIWTIEFNPLKGDAAPAGAGSQTYKKLKLEAKAETENTLNYSSTEESTASNDGHNPAGHQHKGGFPTHTHIAATNAGACMYDSNRWHNISPVLMVLVGMGLVYMIYPAIAPGMIVPFYLVDKIDMILLIATAVPPVIVAILKSKYFGPFVWLGNWGGKHIPPFISPLATTVTKATLNLTSDDSHTLTLQKDTADVMTTKVDVGTQSGNISSIKGKSGNATIKLKLNFAEVTLTDTSNQNTLKAAGSITTTKTVDNPRSGLADSHELLFTITSSSGNLTQELTVTGGNVIIGLGTSNSTLELNGQAPVAGQGKPTNLNLVLAAGTKPKPNGIGTDPNTTLTLNNGNTLQLSGGIEGTLQYSNGGNNHTLTATKIDNVTFNQNDFHDSTTNYPGACCIGGTLVTWQSGESGMFAWHSCDVFVILMIILAIIFVYSLHYRDSAISRAIVNQPKMSTALSIVFYMCHEISLAVGFPGIASDEDVILPVQLVGAFLMVLLAPYSEGYLIEYKRHDPSQWPTTGMTKWNAFCYWYHSLIVSLRVCIPHEIL